MEVLTSHEARVGDITVRRALPRRAHRTVGAWCFADHMGPATVTADRGVDVGPHPHIGLQTVTWLLDGEVLHRDSLGCEQLIRAGQLNLMTAGAGVAHSEEPTGSYAGPLEGIQLWVAQPEATRNGAAAFEHHAELPCVALGGGAEVTVVVGTLAGATSPARADTDHLGAELRLPAGARTEVPVEPGHEHALVVLRGSVRHAGAEVGPGHLAHLPPGASSLALGGGDDGAVVMVLGGTPFPDELVMWWNFVARTRADVRTAREAWNDRDEARFPAFASPLERVPAPPLPW